MNSASIQIFTAPGQPLVPGSVKLPAALGSGEVLVEILLASICGSDLHTVDGRRETPTPCNPGHEGVGRVLQSDRPGVLPGQRVTWTLADSCGTCNACTLWGIPQKCDRLFKYGHAPLSDGHGLNGCYASHLVLRPGTTILPVPDALSNPEVVAANCALATVVNALEQLPVPCDRALIQGAGLLGVYAAAWLTSIGVREIYSTDLSPERQKFMARFGAIPIGQGESISPVDLALEVTGNSASVPEGVSSLRSGGSYIWAGMVHPQTLLKISGEVVVRKCLTVRGVHNYSPRHLQSGLIFLKDNQKRFPFEELTSPPMKLSQINEAFQLARSGAWHRVCLQP